MILSQNSNIVITYFRFYNPGGYEGNSPAWYPDEANNSYLEYTFSSEHVVTGITTRGTFCVHVYTFALF